MNEWLNEWMNCTEMVICQKVEFFPLEGEKKYSVFLLEPVPLSSLNGGICSMWGLRFYSVLVLVRRCLAGRTGVSYSYTLGRIDCVFFFWQTGQCVSYSLNVGLFFFSNKDPIRPVSCLKLAVPTCPFPVWGIALLKSTLIILPGHLYCCQHCSAMSHIWGC